MIGVVPHLTRQHAGAHGADAGAGARDDTSRSRLDFHAEALQFLRALKRNNRREWFQRASRRVRGARPRSR